MGRESEYTFYEKKNRWTISKCKNGKHYSLGKCKSKWQWGHFTLVRVGFTEKTGSWCERGKEDNNLCVYVMWCTVWNQYRSSIKVDNGITRWSKNSTSGYLSKGNEIAISKIKAVPTIYNSQDMKINCIHPFTNG